ncbi:hypothetical protein DV515_00009312, partial [Chloebia gouldiae]
KFFFHLPELDAHGHLRYELLTALLRHLLAVPQVDLADVPTTFEHEESPPAPSPIPIQLLCDP